LSLVDVYRVTRRRGGGVNACCLLLAVVEGDRSLPARYQVFGVRGCCVLRSRLAWCAQLVLGPCFTDFAFPHHLPTPPPAPCVSRWCHFPSSSPYLRSFHAACQGGHAPARSFTSPPALLVFLSLFVRSHRATLSFGDLTRYPLTCDSRILLVLSSSL